jgi:hypothetical protein
LQRLDLISDERGRPVEVLLIRIIGLELPHDVCLCFV